MASCRSLVTTGTGIKTGCRLWPSYFVGTERRRGDMTNFVNRNQGEKRGLQRSTDGRLDPDCLLRSAYPAATTVIVSLKIFNGN